MRENVLHAFFSPETNRFYKLVSTSDLPYLEISGIRMHCVDCGVRKSTEAMVSPLKPLKGKVLDTCCGLGYTTIEIASSPEVEKVFTFEIDANVIEIARQNTFSKGLFENKKIVLSNKTVFEAIKNFPENFFDRILHDPPRFSIARELYGRPFYKELFRALKHGGLLFHYTGNPGKKKGIDFQLQTIRRFQDSGFSEAKKIFDAQGIFAVKK